MYFSMYWFDDIGSFFYIYMLYLHKSKDSMSNSHQKKKEEKKKSTCLATYVYHFVCATYKQVTLLTAPKSSFWATKTILNTF